jgi:hypothetical protein
VSAKIPFPDLLVAAPANKGQFHQVRGRVGPAVVFQADEFTAMTPCVRIGVVRIVKVAEKSKVLPKKQVFADDSFGVYTVLAAANRSHRHLPGSSPAFVDA